MSNSEQKELALHSNNSLYKFTLLLLVLFSFSLFISNFLLQTTLYTIFALLFIKWKKFNALTFIKQKPLFIWLILILYFILINSVNAFLKSDFTYFLKVLNIWPYLSIFPLTILLANPKINRDLIIKSLIISGALTSIYGIVQFFTGTEVLRIGDSVTIGTWLNGSFYKSVGLFTHHAMFGISLLSVWYLNLYIFIKAKKKFDLICLVLIFLGIISTGSKTTFVALLISFLALFLFYIKPRKILMIFIFAITVPVFLILLSYKLPNMIPKSLIARHYIWNITTKLIYEYPFKGIGYDQYRHFSENLIKSDKNVTFTKNCITINSGVNKNIVINMGCSHNQFLDYQVEGGLGLLILFFIFLMSFFYSLKNIDNKYRIIFLTCFTSIIISLYSDCPLKINHSLFVIFFIWSLLLSYSFDDNIYNKSG